MDEKATNWVLDDKSTRVDVNKIVNIAITLLLIIVVAFAVHQRFFEDSKCVNWAKDKIIQYEIEGELKEIHLNKLVDEINSQQLEELNNET